MKYKIPLSYNDIDHSALASLLKAYEGQHHNQLVLDFEASLRQLTGSSHIVAVNSGTSAIHLALKLLGVGNGDLVIAPTFTFVATINPIIYQGAIPILVDVEPITWNIDPVLVKKAILDAKKNNQKIKALLIVHNYGVPAQMDQLMEIARNEDIPVIEDAAEALGATYRGKQVGTLGDIGILSFNNNKTLTTYGGGAIMTERAEWAERALFLAAQARAGKTDFEHQEVGYNYLMSPLNAAYGLLQINDFQKLLNTRRDTFNTYKSLLRGCTWSNEPANGFASRWLSTVLFPDKITRQKAASSLENEHIESRPLWKPMPMQPTLKTYPSYNNGMADDLFSRGLCLPSGNNLSAQEAKVVTNLLIKLHE